MALVQKWFLVFMRHSIFPWLIEEQDLCAGHNTFQGIMLKVVG